MGICERKQFVFSIILFYLFTLQGTLFVKADIQCYQCTSTFLDTNGKPVEGKTNVNCPVDGSVNTAVTYWDTCSDKCLIRTSMHNDGVGIRSCSAQTPLPQPLPQNGCYSYLKDIICVCNTSFCNGEPMMAEIVVRTADETKGGRNSCSVLRMSQMVFAELSGHDDQLKNRTIDDLKSLARAASEEFEKNNKDNGGKFV